MRAKTIIDGLFVAARDHDSFGKARLASAIYRRNKIVSMGFNSYVQTHPLQKYYGTNEDACFLHAEIASIIAAKRGMIDLRGCTMYVARARIIGNKWVTGISRPCHGCQRAIKDFEIQKVFYSLNEVNSFGVMEN